MFSEPVLVVDKLARVFDGLRIPYVVGGSVASSLYGIPRATQDVDLVADGQLSHVDAITSALTGEFYVDADMIRDAITRRASFNVVHLATMFRPTSSSSRETRVVRGNDESPNRATRRPRGHGSYPLREPGRHITS